MICFPNAKINLGLYITERRPDGYHNLETLFLPIPLQDNLELTPLDDCNEPWQLQVTGVPVEGRAEDNLVVRVFQTMQQEFNLPSALIHLHKRIPTGAGLGGGSSDAAFMMRLLNHTYHLGLSNAEMARRLRGFGADCPFFVYNSPHLATGIGDELTPYDVDLSQYTLLLVKPPTGVSTREAYAGIQPRHPQRPLAEVLAQPVEAWRDTLHNDFEDTVFRTHPDIAAIKATLYDMGAVYASMSGSGSSVFALMRHPHEAARRVFSDCFVHQAPLRMHKTTFE